jgi:hypothetical protein
MGIIADVAALARAGYTMADIRELMQTKEPEEPKETPKETTNNVEFPEQSTEPVGTRVVSQTVDTQIETTKDDIDYKAKYQELLAKTQADNRKANFGGEPDNRTDEQKAIDILAAIF